MRILGLLLAASASDAGKCKVGEWGAYGPCVNIDIQGQPKPIQYRYRTLAGECDPAGSACLEGQPANLTLVDCTESNAQGHTCTGATNQGLCKFEPWSEWSPEFNMYGECKHVRSRVIASQCADNCEGGEPCKLNYEIEPASGCVAADGSAPEVMAEPEPPMCVDTLANFDGDKAVNCEAGEYVDVFDGKLQCKPCSPVVCANPNYPDAQCDGTSTVCCHAAPPAGSSSLAWLWWTLGTLLVLAAIGALVWCCIDRRTRDFDFPWEDSDESAGEFPWATSSSDDDMYARGAQPMVTYSSSSDDCGC